MRWARDVILLCCFAAQLQAEEKPVNCESNFTPSRGSYAFVDRTEVAYAIPAESTIRNVYITPLEIFDENNPRENNRLYRFANRIHVLTRPSQIESVLLLESGDVYDPQVVEESARLLRDQKYLYDADIRPVSLCGDEVDLEVITKDVWSLTFDASFDRSGGENNISFGVRDSNLLGTGTELSFRTKQDIDRDSNELVYKNRNIRGSRLSTRLRYSDNDDGHEHIAVLSLPFYSLDSRRAWTIAFEQFEREDEQFFRGDDISEVVQDYTEYRVSYGFSRGLENGVTRRWSLGYRYQDREFGLSDEAPPPAVFPIDKTLTYPFVEFSSIEDNYVRRVNIDQIYRTEDLHIGHSFFTRFGYSDESFGADQDRFVAEGEFRDMLYYNDRHLLLHELEFYGLYNTETDESEDVQLDYQLRYLHIRTRRTSYLASLSATYSKNLNPYRQITLGGDTGVRAFENRLQVGDRKFVINLERRTFTDIHLFNLIRVGWAFFIDVGRAWEPGVDTNFEDDYLANAGFGLRLASSKSNIGRFMHIDLAFPLTNRDDRDVDSSLVSVRLTNRF